MNYGNQEKKNGPEKSFKAGGVRASIWAFSDTGRNGQQYSRKNCTIERMYKATDGSWKSTSSLDTNDVPKAILVLSRAFAYMHESEEPASAPKIKEEFIHDSYPPR